MLKNSSLKTKLLSGFGFLILISAILGFVGYLSITQLVAVVSDLGENNIPSILGLTKMNEAQRIINGAENALLAKNLDNNGRRKFYEAFEDGLNLAAEGRKIYENTESSEKEKKAYKNYISAFDKWIKDHNDFITIARAYEASPTDENYNLMSDHALIQNAASFEASDKILEQIVTDNVKDVEQDLRDGLDEGTEDKITAIVLAIVSVLVGMFTGFYMANYISKSLNKVSSDLRESSVQVASASNELSNAATSLSTSSSEQASSVEETSSSLEEMSGMIQNNVNSAEQAFNLSNKVKEVSEQGNQSMEKLEASMKEILLSNEKIEQLVKVIGNIGEKTQVMDEIVFQTKLLSFNASVEAERAGEHGRGFAVVAQEVGNLAQMSGKAAREIADIVKESIKNTEVITAENKKRVELGNTYVLETGKNLKEIMASASTVSIGAKQVLDASKDQSKGIEQINSAMGQIDKATQDNAATAEEAASSSEELSAQTEVLNNVVEELVKLVYGDKTTQTANAFSSLSAKKSIIGRSAKTGFTPKAFKKSVRVKSADLHSGEEKGHGNGNGHKKTQLEVAGGVDRDADGWDSI